MKRSISFGINRAIAPGKRTLVATSTAGNHHPHGLLALRRFEGAYTPLQSRFELQQTDHHSAPRWRWLG